MLLITYSTVKKKYVILKEADYDPMVHIGVQARGYSHDELMDQRDNLNAEAKQLQDNHAEHMNDLDFIDN